MIELIRRYKVILLVIMIIVTNFVITAIVENRNNQMIVAYNESTVIESNNVFKEELIESDPFEEMDQASIKETEEEATLFPVYICGAVNKPGVYDLAEGTILEDLIQKAGGLNREADTLRINLAKKVTPHSQVYIPKIGEEAIRIEDEYTKTESYGELNAHLININVATLETLETLPGIGAVKAKAIIDYRLEHGPFTHKDALQNISGIGEKTYAQLETLITVN